MKSEPVARKPVEQAQRHAFACPGDLSSNLNDTIFCPQNRAMQDFAISRTSACHCTIGFSLGVSWGYSFLALHFVG
jgi:hypothetical protein